jgi:hypothetical protein
MAAAPTAKLMIWKSQMIEQVACDDEPPLGFSTRRVLERPVADIVRFSAGGEAWLFLGSWNLVVGRRICAASSGYEFGGGR